MQSHAHVTRTELTPLQVLGGRALMHVYALLVITCALSIVSWTYASTAAAAPPCQLAGKRCPQALNMESARGLALGTGARATAISTSALAYNPAAMAVGRLYHVEGAVDYMPDRHTVALGGAIVDSSTSRLAAGLSLRGFLSGDDGIGGIDGRLALALPFSEAVSIGIAGRYLSAKHTDKSLDLGNPAKGFSLDASLRVAPIPMLQLQVGGYNLINYDSAYAPLMVGGGAGVGIGTIAVLGADLLVDLSSYRTADVIAGGGVEVLLGQAVPLRAGYSYDTKREQHAFSVGLGYTDRAVGVDLSLRQDIGGAGDTRLMGAFRFFMH
jgi:hypothetical protein